MPEIGTFGLMSGDGKRSVGHRPQATAPILNSTSSPTRCAAIGASAAEGRPSVARLASSRQPVTLSGTRLSAPQSRQSMSRDWAGKARNNLNQTGLAVRACLVE